MALRDRNSAAQVADYWGVSKRTVNRRIAEGALSCLHLGGVVRITREQVAEYEAQCATKAARDYSARLKAVLGRPCSVFECGQRIAWDQKHGRLKKGRVDQ